MFAYFYVHRRIPIFGIHDHAVKDHQFFRYKAKPDLVIKPDQKIGSTLSLEEHPACGIRLSQNTENNAPRAFVNKNAPVFAFSRKAQANPSGERGPLACWFRLPPEM